MPRTASPEPTNRLDNRLTRTIQDSENNHDVEDSVLHHDVGNEGMSTIYQPTRDVEREQTPPPEGETEITLSMDDTVGEIGDLSTFSAVPNADMTRFANLRASPTKKIGQANYSPNRESYEPVTSTPRSVKRPLHLISSQSTGHAEDPDATPRRTHASDSPTDLLNFTGQSNVYFPPPSSAPRTVRRSPSGRGAFPIRVNPSPTHRSQACIDRERACGAFSPSKHNGISPTVPSTPAEIRVRPYSMADLLDIDLEPMTTPRSIPSVTPRELETLRSELQSKISGLTATLSGKEAEVMALKRAITDAEVRVGNTAEELRNERASREDLEHDKLNWERRGREMENTLRDIGQQNMVVEHERDKLRRAAEEAEKRAEEQEVRILELQAMLESSQKQNEAKSPIDPNAPVTPGSIVVDIDGAVKDATERVARELHALYKGKHETKVAALKNSYQTRWERRVKELETNLHAAREELDMLRSARDDALGGVAPSQAEKVDELLRVNEQLEADRKMLEAKVAGSGEELATVRRESDELRTELEKERIEKGELVAQVDLFLAMDAEVASISSTSSAVAPDKRTMGGTISPSRSASQPGSSNDQFRVSMQGSRARPQSMLKPPGKGVSGLRGLGGRPPLGRVVPPRSGLMEGIARMGSGGKG